MKKLKAIWDLYKCRSFHLVTIEEHIGATKTFVSTTMSQSEFDGTMQQMAEAIASEVLKQKRASHA